MGIIDKAKNLGKKTVDISVKAGHKGVEVSKKGVDATKHAIRHKNCPECKYYAPIDENQGDCPIGGRRLATADIATCPQKAFTPYEIEQAQTYQQYQQQPDQPPYDQTGQQSGYSQSPTEQPNEQQTDHQQNPQN